MQTRGRLVQPAVVLGIAALTFSSLAAQGRGPAPAPIERLRDRFRWQILVSSAHTRALHDVVRSVQRAWKAAAAARAIRLVVDVDPVSML